MNRLTALACVMIAAIAAPLLAADQPGVVCNVKVLSDKVKDVSSIDAWKKSYLADKKTEKDKALACWETVLTYQHQETPPNEFLQMEDCVLDPIKLFNVYGYSLCSVAAAEVNQLARVAGLKARGWTINCHCVTDIRFDGEWHMLDASLINYFPKPDGKIASVQEICKVVQGWLEEHPDLKGNDKKLREFGWAENKTAWKKLGPELLSNNPFYNERGWWPAGTHGWYSTMQEYDGSHNTPFEWESASTLGYQVNIQLRPGERLVRNWSNKGLHVNMDGNGGTPGCIKGQTGKDSLKYTPDFGDIAPGRVGNGRLEYEPPMASLKGSALTYENLTVQDGALRVADSGKPAAMIVRMPSSYVYLNGELVFKAVVGDHGTFTVSFSDNNGLDWKELAKGDTSSQQTIKLPVFRRYDYRLKFEFEGKGTGLDSLKIGHDIQHSQRPLPALAKGDNKITFVAGPQEGTIAVEGSLNAAFKERGGLVYSDFKPTIVGMENFQVKGDKGSITFPVETPGPITRIRAGCFFRAWGPDDGFDVEVSFDGGKTFKPEAFFNKGEKYNFTYLDLKDIPKTTQQVHVRFTGSRKTAVQLQACHVNVDYRQPNAGFRPVKVTYVYDEDGAEKKDEHVARSSSETYTIKCDAKPVMKSIILELAD